MQEMRISTELTASNHQQSCKIDHSQKVDSTLNDNSATKSEVAAAIDDLTFSSKRQKLDEPQSLAIEATEDSVLDWIKNFKDGVNIYSLVNCSSFIFTTEEVLLKSNH